MQLGEIARVVGGELHGDDVLVTGDPFVDSRAATPGGLFVAVVGEHVDGHAYAEPAVALGAAAVLGSRPTAAPTVVVADPVAALGLLARHVRDRLAGLTVVALTGSQGKTGTKDYLAQVLATAGDTVATAGNLNNELGVPLTVLRATEQTRFLVVEMGARGVGHIAYLCEIARPDVAAVINVGTAHIGEFGSREAIAQAKGEIIEGLAADGVAVLNADDPLVAAMAGRTRARVVGFGAEPTDPPASQEPPGPEGSYAPLAALGLPAGLRSGALFRDVRLDDLGRASAVFTLHDDQRSISTGGRVQLRQLGAHQVLNAAAAAAMALGAGLDAATILAGLEQATSLSRWRMELHERADGVAVVNDAYNANPASMSAALDALAGMGRGGARRTIAVLGEMKELGSDAPAAHAEVGEHAARTGVDVLLVVGEAAAPMVEGAGNVTSWSGTAVSVGDRAAALAWLRDNVAAHDVVLVKASRAAALELVAEGLITDRPEDGEND